MAEIHVKWNESFLTMIVEAVDGERSVILNVYSIRSRGALTTANQHITAMDFAESVGAIFGVPVFDKVSGINSGAR